MSPNLCLLEPTAQAPPCLTVLWTAEIADNCSLYAEKWILQLGWVWAFGEFSTQFLVAFLYLWIYQIEEIAYKLWSDFFSYFFFFPSPLLWYRSEAVRLENLDITDWCKYVGGCDITILSPCNRFNKVCSEELKFRVPFCIHAHASYKPQESLGFSTMCFLALKTSFKKVIARVKSFTLL